MRGRTDPAPNCAPGHPVTQRGLSTPHRYRTTWMMNTEYCSVCAEGETNATDNPGRDAVKHKSC